MTGLPFHAKKYDCRQAIPDRGGEPELIGLTRRQCSGTTDSVAVTVASGGSVTLTGSVVTEESVSVCTGNVVVVNGSLTVPPAGAAWEFEEEPRTASITPTIKRRQSLP
jgi:hypothetical protein